MSMIRYQMLYPDCAFRANVYSKNIAPPEDKWAEGALCRDPNGILYIIDRKAGEGTYSLAEIDPSTLGLSSCFMDGNKHEIFEGDIIEAVVFVPTENDETEEPEPEPEQPLDDYTAFLSPDLSKDKPEPEEEDEDEERPIFTEAPEGAEITFTIKGVAFMSGGMFYLQYFDENMGCLNAVPLYGYFLYDMLPAPNTAVKILGNLYDNEDVYNEVLHLNYQAENTEQQYATL